MKIKKIMVCALSLMFIFNIFACGKSNNVSDVFVFDGELSVVEDKNSTINSLSSVDDFNRAMNPTSGAKTDKSRYVGLFYFLWSGQYNSQKVLDINKMLYDGDESLWEANNTQEFHHWGEPLLGYYNSLDPWVIRKHIELLTLADVDFLVFDTTNNRLYYEVLDTLLPIMQEYFDAGWDVPKFVFYTNANSARMIRAVYYGDADSSIADASSPSLLNKDGIYKAGKYKDLWFAPNGKPMIIGVTSDNNGASDQIRWPQGFPAKDTALDDVADKEILDFFELKEAQWPTTGYKHPKGFPWIEFSASPTLYGDTVNVSISQHNKLPFSDALLSDNVAKLMWGRGWHDGKPDHSNDAIYSGQNFEERYSAAIKLDATYTFVTGWNEWVAQKQYGKNKQNTNLGVSETRASFVDTVNTEYSRDAEMMKGGYFDNYYLQLARNNRQLKCGAMAPSYKANKSVDIYKGLTQWNDGAVCYSDFIGDAPKRDFVGHASDVVYKQNMATNDISKVLVASDVENIYFLIESTTDIIKNEYTGILPQIFIQIPGKSGYFGYNYSVTLSDAIAQVKTLGYDGDKLISSNAGQGFYTKGGKYLQVKIPKNILGVGSDYQINFKVADGVDIENIESFYNQGDCAPIGRMNYAYYGK